MIPAIKVLDNVASPKDAPTVFEEISVSLLGSDPLLIKSNYTNRKTICKF